MGIDGNSILVPIILKFLQDRLDTKLAVSTLRVYMAAISAFIWKQCLAFASLIICLSWRTQDTRLVQAEAVQLDCGSHL